MKLIMLRMGKIITFLILIILILVFLYHVSFQHALQIALALPYALFVPGFIWLHVILKKEMKQFNGIEIATLSVTLSMSLVTLAVYMASTFGLKINAWNSFWMIFALISMGGLVWGTQKKEIL